MNLHTQMIAPFFVWLAASDHGSFAVTRHTSISLLGLFLAALFVNGGCTPPVSNYVAPTSQRSDVLDFAAAERTPVPASFFTRLLDEELAGHPQRYKAVVRELFTRQILFCDGTGRPERVTIEWRTHEDDVSIEPGDLSITLKSPGRRDHGDEYPNAMRLRNGGVVAITFTVKHAIDSCPCLTDVHADFVDGDFLRSFAAIDTLDSLDLSHLPITDAEFQELAAVQNLRHVDLVDTDVTFTSIEPNTTIQSLNIDYVHLSDAGLDSLARFSNLRKLDLGRTQVTAERLERLAGLDRLESISFSSNTPGRNYQPRFRYPPRVLDTLTQHKHLKRLEIEFLDLDQRAIETLASMPELEEVTLSAICHGEISFAPLAGHSTLRSVHLTLECEERALFSLHGIPLLETIYLRSGGPDIALDIRDLPRLATVDLHPRRMRPHDPEEKFWFWTIPEFGDVKPDAEVPEFGSAPRVSLTNLPMLELASLRMTDRFFNTTSEPGAIQLDNLPRLRGLLLRHTHGLFDVRSVLFELSRLEWSGVGTPTLINLLESMVQFPNLEQLRIRVTATSDIELSRDDIAPLFTLKHLRKAELTNITGDYLSFSPFMVLPELETLSLSRCRLAADFEVIGHPSLSSLHFKDGAPRSLLLKNLPALECVTITVSESTEHVVLIDCPKFRTGIFTNTFNVEPIDLRQVNVADIDSVRVSVERRRDDPRPCVLWPPKSD